MTGSKQHASRETARVLALFNAQEGRCFHCGKPMLRGDAQKLDRGLWWSREHIYPKGSRPPGGLSYNWVLAHPRCNGARGSRPPTDEEIARAIELHAAIGAPAFVSVSESCGGRRRRQPRGPTQRDFVGHDVQLGTFSMAKFWPRT
jgi:hypothetical protein